MNKKNSPEISWYSTVNRAQRIGQDKKVIVCRYLSENTIEEKINKMQEKKLQLADSLIEANNPLKLYSETEIIEFFQ